MIYEDIDNTLSKILFKNYCLEYKIWEYESKVNSLNISWRNPSEPLDWANFTDKNLINKLEHEFFKWIYEIAYNLHQLKIMVNLIIFD